MTIEAGLSAKPFGQTPSQTIGPFFHYALPWRGGADLVANSDLGARPELFPPEHDVLNSCSRGGTANGEAIQISGTVLDGVGEPVNDALLEIWQADAAGRYPGTDLSDAAPDFTGFGRSATGETGEFRFRTIRPGRVPAPGGGFQAPHIALSIMARGLLKRLITRIYFADAEGNEDDPVLNLVPDNRRHTLIALPAGQANWRFDVRLQGQRETVFFAL